MTGAPGGTAPQLYKPYVIQAGLRTQSFTTPPTKPHAPEPLSSTRAGPLYATSPTLRGREAKAVNWGCRRYSTTA